ncbi:MAG: hypothetical protein LBN30_02610 [Oscillospiraceae bacterium]|jgi:hypothetical protein|nr:hypothetical protein [Oscillospiraceae bacterium]
MKKSIKRLAAAVLSMVMLLTVSSAAAFAAESTLTGSGSTQTFTPWSGTEVTTYTYDSNKQLTDLFGSATKELSPGDSRATDVLLRNQSDSVVTFYLIAKSLTVEQASELTRPTGDFDTKTAANLLEKITLTVRDGNAPADAPALFSNTLQSTLSATANADPLYNGIGAMVLIGAVNPNSDARVNLQVALSKELNNAEQDTLAAFELRFVAYIEPEPSPNPPDYPGDPDVSPSPALTSSPTSEPTVEPTEIAEPSAPLGEFSPPPPTPTPQLTEFPEGSPPLGETPPTDDIPTVVVPPQTGDSGMFTWTFLCAASLTVLVTWLAIVLLDERRKKHEKD